MIEIRFQDIDPDTGRISQDKKIAVCETESMARWVLYSLQLVELQEYDPNRTIYTIPEITKMIKLDPQ